MVQGTRPSKKLTNIKDVKRYLQVATIATDGLLVVKRDEPLGPSRECIIVPRQILDGLLTALHIQLSHPSSHQLKQVAKRHLFALDLDKAIDRVTQGCHCCTALRQAPRLRVDQTSCPPPDTVGISFAAGVLKRSRQLILVVRECVTAFTSTALIDNEQHQTLRDALIRLCIPLRPLDGPMAIIRTDPASGFKALANDDLLLHHRLKLELGDAKNANKNPVAERAVQELERELVRLDSTGGQVSQVDLATATAALNSRLRSRGLSAREMRFQRDQFTNHQISTSDQHLITKQHEQRSTNHPYSAKSKVPVADVSPTSLYPVEVGDLVYLYSDGNKVRSRDRYLVVSVDGLWCNVRKFAGAQLRSARYRVRKSDCFRVPPDLADPSRRDQVSTDSDESSDDELPHEPPRPPCPPVIPQAISSPGPKDPPDSHATNIDSDNMDARELPPSSRSGRERHRPSRFDDYVTEFA